MSKLTPFQDDLIAGRLYAMLIEALPTVDPSRLETIARGMRGHGEQVAEQARVQALGTYAEPADVPPQFATVALHQRAQLAYEQALDGWCTEVVDLVDQRMQTAPTDADADDDVDAPGSLEGLRAAMERQRRAAAAALGLPYPPETAEQEDRIDARADAMEAAEESAREAASKARQR